MVLQAIARLAEGDSPILHSDQGIQYQMASYQLSTILCRVCQGKAIV